MNRDIEKLKGYISTTDNKIFATFKIEDISNLIIYYEQLQEKLDKINKIYDSNTHCENIYYGIGVVLDKEYCYIEDCIEDIQKIIKGDSNE